MSIQQAARPARSGRTEKSAVVGFVLALLFWPAGLLVSTWALKKIRRWGGGGGGLALAGVAISLVVGVSMVVVLATSTVGAVRSQTFQTSGQAALCEMDLERVNKSLETYNATETTALTGTAAAQLAALRDAGYLASVPQIPGLDVDARGRITGAC